MSFSPEQLKLTLQPHFSASVLWVAYSGGCDSHALLHSLLALREEIHAEIKAVHINHALSPDADEWELHCQKTCEQLNVPYKAIKVDAKSHDSSPEEAARHARYAAWRQLIKKDEVILLAHHRDDQAETVLLQLMRGAGVKGLAAMPEQQKFAQGAMCRPLLSFTRASIQHYAEQQGLKWIDDPSNFDTDFDRNFLRHQVVPLLETRWPSLKKTLPRTAAHSAEADYLLSQLAAQDWLQVQDGPSARQVKIANLLKLEKKRQRNVIRYWLALVCQLRLPDTVHLQRIFDEVVPAADDAVPEVVWRGGEVRRYQGLLYAQEALPLMKSDEQYIWTNITQPLTFAGRCLTAQRCTGQGLSLEKLAGAEITLRFRQGGETCKPAGRGQTHHLKKLFQEWQVPPWLRTSVPLLYVNNELAAVVGYCYCDPFVANSNEASWSVSEKI